MELNDGLPLVGYSSPEMAKSMETARGWLGQVRIRQELGETFGGFPMHLADVGGGNGHFARWLHSAGHDVALSDLEPALVEMSRAHRTSARHEPMVADARSLPYPDEDFDGVLALGPMYHLNERDDRVALLRELQRITRPGGTIMVEFISRESYAIWYAYSQLGDREAVLAAEHVLDTGEFINVHNRSDFFLDSYAHDVRSLQSEFADAGLKSPSLHALEGPYWPVSVRPDGSPLSRADANRLLRWAHTTRELSSVISLSPHNVAICVA